MFSSHKNTKISLCPDEKWIFVHLLIIVTINSSKQQHAVSVVYCSMHVPPFLISIFLY